MTPPPLAASTVSLRGGFASSPVGAARARVSTRRGALFTLSDHLGNKGFGEASPLPGHSPESLEESLSALDGAHRWLAENSLDAPFEALSSPRVRAMPGSARFALETALLDLVAKRRGISLHALLSGREDDARAPVNAYVGAALDDALLDDARAALARGITTLKVKIAGSDGLFDRERSALVALREQLPGDWTLRLDANAAWTLPVARARLEALSVVSPAFVEQPVAVGILRALGRCAVAWAIDESLSDPDDTSFALKEGPRAGCVAVVIKPAMHGLVGAYELAQRASESGLGVVITHLFDGPVALAAACELALALRDPLACGLDLHPGLAAWEPVEIPQRREAAFVTASRAPGLGLDLAPMLSAR